MEQAVCSVRRRNAPRTVCSFSMAATLSALSSAKEGKPHRPEPRAVVQSLVVGSSVHRGSAWSCTFLLHGCCAICYIAGEGEKATANVVLFEVGSGAG
ncbi:hypothetical protein SESBI_45137, partial [Sesbania bispinosa]